MMMPPPWSHPRWCGGRLCVALAVAVIALAPPGTRADQSDPALDALFERLRTVEDRVEGERITNRIWVLWREIDDPDLAAAMEQGIVALRSDRHAEAERRFSAVIEAEPGYAEAWNKRATVRYLRGRYVTAAADIRHALTLEPRHFGALAGLGLVYMQLERYRAAIESFQRARGSWRTAGRHRPHPRTRGIRAFIGS